MFRTLRAVKTELGILRSGTVRTAGAGRPRVVSRAWAKFVARVVVTAALLGAGMHIILSGGYDAETRQWASGWIGAVIGYWLA